MNNGLRSRQLVGWIVAVWGALTALPCGAVSLHVDTFPADLELQGWGNGASTYEWVPGGGPDGTGDGFHRASAGFGRLATYNSEERWIGDYTSLGAVRITADLMVPSQSQDLDIRLVAFGDGDFIQGATRLTSTVAAQVPADSQWRSYSFELSESALTTVFGASSYADVMADVQRIMFRYQTGEPMPGGSGVFDFVADLGIDNVTLVGSVAALQGDFNDDGIVDAADYTVWRDNFGAGEGVLPPGTGDGSGTVDNGDYDTWREHFGSTAAIAVDSAAVPEPSSIVIAFVFALATGTAVRRSKRH